MAANKNNGDWQLTIATVIAIGFVLVMCIFFARIVYDLEHELSKPRTPTELKVE